LTADGNGGTVYAFFMPIRILVVDDYEPLRRAIRFILQMREELQIAGEASDGLEAFQKAKELQPDLILLDIDLPTLNGLQVARRLRDAVPRAKILFVTVENSPEVVQQALRTGAAGYVYKLSLTSELLPAIEAALANQRFISNEVRGTLQTDAGGPIAAHRHEMLIYSEEKLLVEAFTEFISGALRAGTPVIAAPTKPHLDRLMQSLHAEGIEIDKAIRNRLFTLVDAAVKLSSIMVNDMPDRVHCTNAMSGYVAEVRKTHGADSRVALCGECAPVLLSQGNGAAAIRLEEFCNSLPNTERFDFLCAYPLDLCTKEHEKHMQRICAEHSAVSSR
jgi:DNA-binding NarL/FixJ family response regulator